MVSSKIGLAPSFYLWSNFSMDRRGLFKKFISFAGGFSLFGLFSTDLASDNPNVFTYLRVINDYIPSYSHDDRQEIKSLIFSYRKSQKITSVLTKLSSGSSSNRSIQTQILFDSPISKQEFISEMNRIWSRNQRFASNPSDVGLHFKA